MAQGMWLRCTTTAGLLGCLVVISLLSFADALATEPAKLQTRLRRPVALTLTDDGKWLFVANQRSGTISTIDTATLRTCAEVSGCRRLADIASTPDGRRVLALDEEAGELVLFD